MQKPPQQNRRKEPRLQQTIYSRCLLTRKIVIPIVLVGKNIVETFEKYIAGHYEGRCIVEGFVKPGSSKIITYSSGTIQKGTEISFQVVFECDVCFLVEGMLIQCVAKNITKAGIRAESPTETPSPIVVFIAKDHNYSIPAFASVQEGDVFTARIIGQRYQLNDEYVSVIAEFVVPRPPVVGFQRRPPEGMSVAPTPAPAPAPTPAPEKEIIRIQPKKRPTKLQGTITVA